MRTVFNMPIVDTKCPENKTERTCELRKYIQSDQKTFHVSINETYLVPNTDDVSKIARTIIEMRNICYMCQNAANPKTR